MDCDALVIGAGPNGLFAACTLARAGLRVLVLEANDRPGGALWTESTTAPGHLHDVGAGFIAFRDSEAFQELDLERHGLQWVLGDIESCHPDPAGGSASIARSPGIAESGFGSTRDDRTWQDMVTFHRRIDPVIMQFLGTLPVISPAFQMHPMDAFRLARIMLSSTAGFAERFESEAARRVVAGMAMHVDIGPDDRFGCGMGYMLCLRAAVSGFAFAKGGSRAITDALLAELKSLGGELRTGAEVTRIRVRQGRTVGIELADGTPIDAKTVMADTSAPALYLSLLDQAHVPGFVRRRMATFPYGWGTFKLDLALDRPVAWTAPDAHRAAVVHAGDDLTDLRRFAAQVRAAEIPDHPYLVIGQQCRFDPTRAPKNAASLYVYSRAPANPAGGWEQHKEAFADCIIDRIAELAPGFSATVRARAIHTPGDLQRMSRNLVGGDLGGGTAAWHRQLFSRPVFPYFRYRTPVRGVYLCSMFTHPGTGIHGMCGFNAAKMALRDL